MNGNDVKDVYEAIEKLRTEQHDDNKATHEKIDKLVTAVGGVRERLVKVETTTGGLVNGQKRRENALYTILTTLIVTAIIGLLVWWRGS